jgi:hypothetical protein
VGGFVGAGYLEKAFFGVVFSFPAPSGGGWSMAGVGGDVEKK